jgi:hypothetical protein
MLLAGGGAVGVPSAFRVVPVADVSNAAHTRPQVGGAEGRGLTLAPRV